jgi:hypothetical protein
MLRVLVEEGRWKYIISGDRKGREFPGISLCGGTVTISPRQSIWVPLFVSPENSQVLHAPVFYMC